MRRDESLQRQIDELIKRITDLERELRGLRSERRPRWTYKRDRWDAVVSSLVGIPPGGSGEVTIYVNNLPTSWKPTVWNYWMHSNRTAAYNTEVVIEFKPDKNRFELASEGCSAGGIHAPLT